MADIINIAARLPTQEHKELQKLLDDNRNMRRKKERKREQDRYHAGKRRAILLQRQPAWADVDAIRLIYAEAIEKTLRTGIQHHVDHIIPLRGKTVCGLHVDANLQVLEWSENLEKFNKFEVDG